MDAIDPEVRERLAIDSLRNLLARRCAEVRTLIDDDAAFGPTRLTSTRNELRSEIRLLEEIATEALLA